MSVKIAPSILSADFAHLGRDIQRISDADYVHVDVMDGLFVPNISIGIPVVKSIRPTTALPLDVHLMIVEPGRYVEQFCDAGADLVTVHVESYEKNRDLLYHALKEDGFTCAKPDGAFYLFVKSPVPDEKEFCETAKKHHVLMVPGSSFACPGYVRIAYCVSYEQIKRSLPAFREIAGEYGLLK